MLTEKIYILKHTPQGLEMEIGRKSEDSFTEASSSPSETSVTQLPRWQHWNERKLARLWYATLLGMNIEPTQNARATLKANYPEKYQIYRDRLDIAKTLIGYELAFYEDHMLEGDLAGEKYVSLAEYYTFALGKGWKDLESMRNGLHMDSAPPILNIRKENNYLYLLYLIFKLQAKGFISKKPTASATAIQSWLKEIGANCPVDERTLINWVKQMNKVAEEKADKLKTVTESDEE